MFKFKLVAIFVVLAMSVSSFNMQAEKGEKSVGLIAGYNTKTESGLAGIYFQYQCNSWLRLSPDVQTLFRKNNLSAFHINGNVHYIINIQSNMSLYPLAGVTYQSWRHKAPEGAGDHNNLNRFGVNVGCGYDFNVTSSLKFLIEGKYSFVKDCSSATIALGLGYTF